MERKRFEESDGIERGVEEEGILKSQGEKERKKERLTAQEYEMRRRKRDSCLLQTNMREKNLRKEVLEMGKENRGEGQGGEFKRVIAGRWNSKNRPL